MIGEYISNITVDHFINLTTNVVGVLLGAALAIMAQRYFLRSSKHDSEYAAIVETQIALYRQHEVAQQLRKDLLEKFQKGQFLPAYHSIFEAPKIPLEKIAFLAAGKKGEDTDPELLHEILLAQASYENISMAIQRHNAHQDYILKTYDAQVGNNGRLKLGVAEDSYDVVLARNNAALLYDLCPKVLSNTQAATERVSTLILKRFPRHQSLRFTLID